MGVMRRGRFDEAKPVRIEDTEEFNYADYDLTESDDERNAHNAQTENEACAPLISRSRLRREQRAEKKLRKFLNAMDTDGVNVKKNMGARKQRRIENARLLMSFVDKEDICTDFSDMVPQSVSAFAQLFEERENMKIWNEFIRLEEMEQRRILENADRRSKRVVEAKPAKGDGWFVVGGRNTSSTSDVHNEEKPKKKLEVIVEKLEKMTVVEEEDHRQHHPAYSAKACFRRLDARFKQVLKQKSLPWAFIDNVERQLRALYLSDPDAVWVVAYESGLHRMLVHAIAQYLMLTSKSVTDDASLERITEVRNPRAFFIPPHESLIPYLEKGRNCKIEFVPETDECDGDLLDCSIGSSSSEPEILEAPSERDFAAGDAKTADSK